jgi:hypothetical protein
MQSISAASGEEYFILPIVECERQPSQGGIPPHIHINHSPAVFRYVGHEYPADIDTHEHRANGSRVPECEVIVLWRQARRRLSGQSCMAGA